MINYIDSYPKCQEEERTFIENKIVEFAERVVRHGIDSTKFMREDDALVDTLYEYIEENIETYLPEETYDV